MDMLLLKCCNGTGRSNHCMDLMGNAEQTFDSSYLVGYARMSNGAVSMIGKSYDGSTPWQAATFGNEYEDYVLFLD